MSAAVGADLAACAAPISRPRTLFQIASWAAYQVARSPSPTLLGKVARRAGWGVARGISLVRVGRAFTDVLGALHEASREPSIVAAGAP